MTKPMSVYLDNVANIWRQVANNSNSLVVLSPYITSTTATDVLLHDRTSTIKVYTLFRAEVFASGASSIHTLKELYNAGVELYYLPNLHAKIVLSPDGFVSIGSQNLTNAGTYRKESTVVINDGTITKDVRNQLQPWLLRARPISLSMIDRMIEMLPAAEEIYNQLLMLTDNIDNDIAHTHQNTTDRTKQLDDIYRQRRLEWWYWEQFRCQLDEDDNSLHLKKFNWINFQETDLIDGPADIPERYSNSETFPLHSEFNGASYNIIQRSYRATKLLWGDDVIHGIFSQFITNEPDDESQDKELEKLELSLLKEKHQFQLEQLHHKLNAATSSRSVWCIVRNERGKFIADTQSKYYYNQLIRWHLDDQTIELKRCYRYLCLIKHTGELGWVRISKWRASRVERILTDNYRPISFFGIDYKPQLKLISPDISTEPANAELRLFHIESDTRLDSPVITIKFWVSYCDIEAVTVHPSNLTFSLKSYIDSPGNKLLRDVRRMLTDPFKYSYALTGVEADEFFGPEGTEFDLSIRELDGSYLFVADFHE